MTYSLEWLAGASTQDRLGAFRQNLVENDILAAWVSSETSSACLLELVPRLSITQLSEIVSTDEEVQKSICFKVCSTCTNMPEVVGILRRFPIHFVIPHWEALQWLSPELVMVGLDGFVLPALKHKRSAIRLLGLKLLDKLLHAFPYQTTFPILAILTARDEETILVEDFFANGKVRVNFLALLMRDDSLSVKQALYRYLNSWCFDLKDHADIDWCIAPFLMTGLCDLDMRPIASPRVTPTWVQKTARRYLPCLLKSMVDFGACTDENRLALLETTLEYLQENLAEYLPALMQFVCHRNLRKSILACIGKFVPPSQWWPLFVGSNSLQIITLLKARGSRVALPGMMKIADCGLIEYLDPSPEGFLRELELGVVSHHQYSPEDIASVFPNVAEIFTNKLSVKVLCQFIKRSNKQFTEEISELIGTNFDKLNMQEKHRLVEHVNVCELVKLVLTNQSLILPILCKQGIVSSGSLGQLDLTKVDIDTLHWWITLFTQQGFYSDTFLDVLVKFEKSHSLERVVAMFDWIQSTKVVNTRIIEFLISLSLQFNDEKVYALLKNIVPKGLSCDLLLSKWQTDGFLSRIVLLQNISSSSSYIMLLLLFVDVNIVSAQRI